MRGAKVASIQLDPAAISIERERETDFRVFNIAIELPITIDYLGKERVFQSVVHVNESVPVDHAAENRRLAQQKRRDDRIGRINAANDKLIGALKDCERATGGPCEVQGNPGMGSYLAPDDIEIIKNY